MHIETPVGVKQIRDSQLSIDGRHLYVRDVLLQWRWVAIDSIHEVDGHFVHCMKNGGSIRLQPTVFTEG